MKDWLYLNLGKHISTYKVVELACDPYLKNIFPLNIILLVRSTGMYPFIRGIFVEMAFFPSLITGRLLLYGGLADESTSESPDLDTWNTDNRSWKPFKRWN